VKLSKPFVGKGAWWERLWDFCFLLWCLCSRACLELKSVAKKLATKADLDDVVPDFSYKTYSPYDVPVEDHHLSCHWHEKSS